MESVDTTDKLQSNSHVICNKKSLTDKEFNWKLHPFNNQDSSGFIMK